MANGFNNSNTRNHTSSTSKTTKHLMFQEVRMKNVEKLLHTTSYIMVPIKSGRLFILIKLIRKLQVD